MNRSFAVHVALVAFSVFITHARSDAAPGDLDPAFGGFGTGGKIMNSGLSANAIALDAQGRLVLAGSRDGTFFVQRRSGPRFTISEERSFIIDGGQQSADANAVAIAPDGKIVVAGTVFFPGGGPSPTDFAVARLNPDLTLDDTFAGDGTTTSRFGDANDLAHAVAVQSDNKIVVGGLGELESIGSFSSKWAVERFNENGTLDSSFNGNGKWAEVDAVFPVGVTALAIQDDGKILASGGADHDLAVVRLNPDGSMDGTFDGDGYAHTGFGSDDEYATGVALGPSGEIVLVGGPGTIKLVRHLPNGALDPSFDGDGRVTTTLDQTVNAKAVTVQPDHKVVVGGQSGGDFVLVRYNFDGSLDGTFGEGGKVITVFSMTASGVKAVALQTDGFLIAAGAHRPRAIDGTARSTRAGSRTWSSTRTKS